MNINISGIFIDETIDIESSDLRTELDNRYGEMKLFINKKSTSKITTAYQGESNKNRYSIFWNHFDQSTFIIAELHPLNEIIEKLSLKNKILTFRISDDKGIYIIALYENGKLKRRKIWCDPSFGLYKHFMKHYSEFGNSLKSELENDGRTTVLEIIKNQFGIRIGDLSDKTKFNRLTYKADKQKMREWLKENE